MRRHSGVLEQKWNRQLTRPIFPAAQKMRSGDETISQMGLHHLVNCSAI